MNRVRWTPIKRYWLLLVITLFWLLTLAVNQQAPVLAQLPTPDVKTVPDLEDLVTPTPTTPAPLVVVTATPVPGATAVENESPGNESPDGGAPAPGGNGQPAPAVTNGGTSSTGSTATGAPTTSNATGNGTALVNTTTLNVRAAPSTTSAIVDQLVGNSLVTLLRQDQDPNWWYICCGTTNNLPGWVNGQYLLITAAPLLASSAGATTAAPAQPALQVQLIPQQRFVWQGQRLTVQFNITNPKTEKIRLLSIRTDLPPELQLLTATTNAAGSQEIQGQATAGPVVILNWPEVTPNTTVTATLDLQIATEVANGAFIDLIAAVSAEGEAPVLSGIKVIMPPKRLPLFR